VSGSDGHADAAAAALRFKREHLLRAVERVERLDDPPGALAARTPSLPHVYELNLVIGPATAGGAALAAAAARLGLPKVRVEDGASGVTFPPGWDADRELVMVRRRASDRPPAGAHAVRPLGVEELAPSDEAFLRTGPHDHPAEVRRQLVAQHERWEAAAPRAARLGIAEAGRVVAWCRVYDDGTLTEIDAVGVLPAERGRGLGRALVEGVVERIPPERTVFLVADEDDWPRRLYDRLGFDVVGVRLGATRAGSAAP
jgi:ribosomal protein S18 acetylase RimI-like enzyme